MTREKKQRVMLELVCFTDGDFTLDIENLKRVTDEKTRTHKMPLFPSRSGFCGVSRSKKPPFGYFAEDRDVIFVRNALVDERGEVYGPGTEVPQARAANASLADCYLRIVDTLDQDGLIRLYHLACELLCNRFDCGPHGYLCADWYGMMGPVVEALDKTLRRVINAKSKTAVEHALNALPHTAHEMSGNYSGTGVLLCKIGDARPATVHLAKRI